MISILIPVYNFDISALLCVLDTQLKHFEKPYEIICYEDGSKDFLDANARTIESIPHAKHLISKKNAGRLSSRKDLAKSATYNWLLFLDADMCPKNDSFLSHYSKYLESDHEAIYGGYYYAIEDYHKEKSLRWLYGKKYEEVNARKRNLNPYKIILSGNYLIKKKVFIELNSYIKNDGYGYDNYFGAIMKLNKTKVIHIDNPTIHKGLNSNIEYLKKVEEAVHITFIIFKKFPCLATENSLLEVFKKLKFYRLSNSVGRIFKISKATLVRNLKGDKPNLLLLQFYKLGHLCSLKPS